MSLIALTLFDDDVYVDRQPKQKITTSPFKSLWRSMTSLFSIPSASRVYFISNIGAQASINQNDADNPISYSYFCQHLMPHLNNNDVVYLSRDEVYDGEAFAKAMQEKQIWVRAYGCGESPLLKTNGAYHEILDCNWI